MSSPASRRWSAILAQYRASGLSLRAFAEAHGLNPHTLSWWRWSLGRAHTQEAPAILEVDVCGPGRSVTLVHSRLGICVEVGPDADLRRLREILEALC